MIFPKVNGINQLTSQVPLVHHQLLLRWRRRAGGPVGCPLTIILLFLWRQRGRRLGSSINVFLNFK
jgi:hypothetical protein